jgi:hypothetical protein
MAQQITKEDRSLGELFSELATETSTLVKQEVALAQTELTQKATKVGKMSVFSGRRSSCLCALLAFIAGLIIILGNALGNHWLAAFIIGIVIAIAAVVMIMSALSAFKTTGITHPNS